jgi:hypothetical protein
MKKNRHNWNKPNDKGNFKVQCVKCGIYRDRLPSPIKYKDYLYYFNSKEFIWFNSPGCIENYNIEKILQNEKTIKKI